MPERQDYIKSYSPLATFGCTQRPQPVRATFKKALTEEDEEDAARDALPMTS